MPNPLADRLGRFVELTPEEQSFLGRITEPTRTLHPDAHIPSKIACSPATYIVAEGYACEYRILRGGGRQIVRLLLPSDIFHLKFSQAETPRSNLVALTSCQVASIHEQGVARIIQVPRLAKAWTEASDLDSEALIEHIVRIGRKSALACVAHVICEFQHRMKMLGVAKENIFAFPLNQQELGDLVGVSTVHTNRSLRSLVDMGLINYNQRYVTVFDEANLRRVAEFSEDYLTPKVSSNTGIFLETQPERLVDVETSCSFPGEHISLN